MAADCVLLVLLLLPLLFLMVLMVMVLWVLKLRQWAVRVPVLQQSCASLMCGGVCGAQALLVTQPVVVCPAPCSVLLWSMVMV